MSRRLRVLKSERLVKDTRRGKHKLYSIADQHVLELVRNALAHAQENITSFFSIDIREAAQRW